MGRPWLSVIVPAYNEAEQLPGTLAALRAGLDGLGRPWEVLVVDNASTDGTPHAIAPQLDSRMTLLRNALNQGKGYSVRRGMRVATGELRLHCDADCAPSLASLDRLLSAVHAGADVVAGSRLAAGAQLGRRQPLGRRIVGRTFVDLSRLALREPTRDLFCGFKLWREEAATAVFARTRLDGWVFDAEALALARRLGFRIAEVGVAWSDRDGSRLSMPRTVVPALRELRRARSSVRAASTAAG